jgi:cephalosporin hydroxylase
MRFSNAVEGRISLLPEREGGKVVECLMTSYEPLVYDTMCDFVPDGARCAEVGSFKGGSASILAHGMSRRGKTMTLFCHDLFEPFEVDGVTHDIDGEFDAAMREWASGVSVEKVKGRSSETHGVHEDGSLDYVFIDGDHSFEGAHADIVNFSRALKPGGWMLVQDCKEEVLEAVEKHYGDERKLMVRPPWGHYVAIFAPAEKLAAFNDRADVVYKHAWGQRAARGSTVSMGPPMPTERAAEGTRARRGK